MTGLETFALLVGLAGVAWVLGDSLRSDLGARFSRKKRRVRAKHRGRRFTIEFEGPPTGGASRRSTIELLLAPSARHLDIRKAGAFGPADERIGDDRFDARVRLRGDRARLLAALSPGVRVRILQLLERGDFSVTPTALRFSALGTDESRVRDLDDLVALADELRVTQVERRLARHAALPDHPGVRLQNFLALAARAPRHADTRRTGKILLASTDDALRAAAWEWALGVDDRDAMRDAVDFALDRPPDSSTESAIRFLARIGDLTRAERLPALAHVAADGSALSTALAAWTTAIAPHRPLPEWVALLAPGVAYEVQAAVLAFLRDHGTVETVEPLLQFGRSTPRLRTEARDAVRAIQERLGDADAGRLTVLGPPDASIGGLSVAAEGGALAVVDEARPPDRTRA